jgi:hypothetical protein
MSRSYILSPPGASMACSWSALPLTYRLLHIGPYNNSRTGDRICMKFGVVVMSVEADPIPCF